MELSVSSLKYAAFFLLLQQICSSHLVSSSSIHSDKLALLSFKLQLSNNPLGPLSSWNYSLPLCRWAGVTCGGHQHPDRVTGLELESLELEGPIPKSLANLTFLKRLHLPNNSFQGFIPKELGQLFRLEYVNLSSNSLKGGIPQSLLNCSHLQMISLRSNMLQGEIPPNFPPLTTLDLSNNMFTGVIPPSLGNLTRLTYLDLSNNSLTGSIPSSAGMLSMVTFFDLSRNNLAGDLPPAIWNLTHVTKFEVHDNNLSGALPMDLGDRFPHLRKLLLFDNNFTGPIPLSISNASELENIQLFYNGFSGTIPHNLGLLQNLYSLILGNNLLEATNVQDWRFFTGLVNCSNLQVLDVSNNMLGGILPDAIVNLTTGLTWLGMMGNHISGTIPKEIANLVNLRLLRMRQNYLTGSIPPSIGRLHMLNVLHLSQNMFHGEIPMEIGNLTQLSRLYLEENQLTGRVPESIAKCKTLQLLNLGYNNLTGTIPAEIMSMSSLSIYLSFSSNSLTGLLPSEIGSLTSLDALDISNNNLSGEVPSTLGKCISIEYIFMEGNFFGGSIPSTLRQLKGLQVLDFSRNNFSGQIPEFLAGFIYLHNLNLSFNKFEGEVPKDGIFANLSAISIYGNNNLCGGSPALDLPACPIQSPAKKHDSAKLTKIIAVVSTVSCFMLLCCSLIAWHYIKKSRRPLKVLSQKTQHLRITYSGLAKATDGFSAANLIGAGSFGSVYRAVMEFDEAKIVAVKVIDQKQKGATKSFMAECEALRNIRHRNLIKIFTTCSSADFRGNAFNALIFEFMPNGSLERWLHPLHHEELGSPNLSLVQRLDIAIDVANALDYLHHRIAVPVVHCDLKPSNVLLDDDMVAHVGDFGLARFLDRSANGTPTKSTSSSGLKGTVGYVAPEYGMANKVSTQGDVYSYGILLLEMFTGRRPTDQDFMEGLSLRNFVATAFPGQLIKIVDERMFLDIDAEGNNDRNKRDKIHECLASVLRIGLDCTQELPSERMYMGDVTKELMATKAEFLQECCSAEVKRPSSM